MASFLFNSLLRDESIGAVDFDTDTFRMSLHTSALAANKDTHDRFDDMTNEVVGTGYTAGGAVTSVSVGAVDTANDRVDITFGAVSWPSSTITARYGIIRKARGGLASADELVAQIDFGSDIISTVGTFSVTASIYRKTNP
jgi:hypothetical protein